MSNRIFHHLEPYRTSDRSARAIHTNLQRNLYAGLRIVALAAVLSGCGTSTPTDQADFEPFDPEPASEFEGARQTPARMAAAAHHGDIELAAATSATASTEPAKGSADWLLQEIVRLRTAPIDVMRQPIPGQPGAYEEVKLSAEQIERERLRRYELTIQYASQVISKTHPHPEQEQAFNSAVHYLSDARMQLALLGHEQQPQLLVENAEALFQRDPTSFAAVESASRVLQLTQTMATRDAQPDPKWVLAFARQARLFAVNFPQETNRAAVHVLAAGQMCEQTGATDDARACYAWIEQSLPGTPYSDQVASPLRRMRLVGQPLTEFGGSTWDGGHLSIDQYRGKSVLIAFWTSNSAQFQQDLPRLQSGVNKFLGRVAVVGVNLDRDDRAVAQFLQQTGLTWPQIFFSDPDKRGEHNLVAWHYGVTNVPQYWLVDSRGIVRSVNVDIAHLDEELAETFTR
ncbi:TlpA family protein disulfide reductase [Planctomicrobium piriforme]|uniref:Thiol-disulfide isomerase or thioredoxin n=1 Tax=Planctomicrobium piriforme TaxID=1576369 RepID=A0A1I3T3S7_9PLAN|nr:TlpA disulfide reductase family protein [Planctomicrobium piriforme]SFJ65162.1 Thiol-disulfide isomerase or thioredoxin [Planctomicrobium piriforme]